MSTAPGYIRIARKAYHECPFWNERRVFSRWEAWEWLIQAAAWKEHRRTLQKSAGVVCIRRGETPPLSVRYLAAEWGWTKSRVSRFLAELQNLERIRDGQRTADGDTYVLVNYEFYQGERDSLRDSQRDAAGTDAGQTRDKIEEKKAGKEELLPPTTNARGADGETKGTAAPTAEPEPAASTAGAVDSSETFDVALAAIRACNAGMSKNPAIGTTFRPILGNHPKSYQQVHDWLAAGVSRETILGVVAERARQFEPTERNPQISSLVYLRVPVLEAHDRLQAVADAATLPAPAASSAGPGSRREHQPRGAQSVADVLDLQGAFREWAERMEERFTAAPPPWTDENEANIRRAWSGDPRWAKWSGRFQRAVIRIRTFKRMGDEAGDVAPGALPPDA